MAIDRFTDGDLISGYKYFATMQLRTPLAALLFDGTFSDAMTKPANPHNDAHGIWVIQVKTWRDLGIDMDEISEIKMASDIGYVDHAKYLRFLISVRMIAEDNDRTIDERIAAIKSILKDGEFSTFARKLGSQSAIINKLFVRIISTMPCVNTKVTESLWKARKRTVAAICAMSESSLLALDGIGPKSFAAIRAFCDAFQGDLTAERFGS